MQGLDVDKDVKKGKVTPGQYLVLSFDFAKLYPSDDLKVTELELSEMMINSIKAFYQTYASYLGNDTSKQLIRELVDSNSATSSLTECVRVVQEALRAAEGVSNHRLADVKGVSDKLPLPRLVELLLTLEYVLTDLSHGRRIRRFQQRVPEPR